MNFKSSFNSLEKLFLDDFQRMIIDSFLLANSFEKYIIQEQYVCTGAIQRLPRNEYNKLVMVVAMDFEIFLSRMSVGIFCSSVGFEIS